MVLTDFLVSPLPLNESYLVYYMFPLFPCSFPQQPGLHMLNNNFCCKYLMELILPSFLGTYLQPLLLFNPFVEKISAEHSLNFLSCHSLSEFHHLFKVIFLTLLSVKENTGLLRDRFGQYLHHNLIYSFSVCILRAIDLMLTHIVPA